MHRFLIGVIFTASVTHCSSTLQPTPDFHAIDLTATGDSKIMNQSMTELFSAMETPLGSPAISTAIQVIAAPDLVPTPTTTPTPWVFQWPDP